MIRGGKGKKGRTTLLSEKLLKLLREYYRVFRPKVWRKGGSTGLPAPGKFFRACQQKAGITNKATPHSPRHSFAAHLLEQGVDLRYIQALLGHRSSNTTEIDTHITSHAMEKIKSPLDSLNI